MNSKLRQQILDEATGIGDELLSLAEHDKHGISWKTMSIDFENNSKIIWRKSESIYSGVAGIVLFFLELYKTTRNEKYLDAAIAGMHWVEQYFRENPTDYFAFYTGRMGVAYCMLKMAEATNENEYLEKALTITRWCLSFLESRNRVNDLLNGTSGTLLGLLHLHAATQKGWILDAINLFIKHLIDQAHSAPEGLYWDRSSQHIRGLCGFSHGAAGIGFVFLELGHYFQNDAFYWMAEQAFLYESHYYDESIKNWPDFRKGIYKPEDYEEHEKAYLEQNFGFFAKAADMNAWCHGAAGIGLSRLRALELLNSQSYAKDVNSAIEKTSLTDVERENSSRSFIICHGAGGNAELFLEAYRTLGQREYLSFAEKIVLEAIKTKKDKKTYLSGYANSDKRQDLSLFMGNAGIGYFYLKFLNPLKTPSILAPKLDSTIKSDSTILNYQEINISISDVRKRVMQKKFNRTLFLVEKNFPEEMNLFFAKKQGTNRTSEKEKFISFVENEISRSPHEAQERIADTLALELAKIRMDETISSHALQYIKAQIERERAKELLEKDKQSFFDLHLILDPDVQLRFTHWNWNPDGQKPWRDNLNLESSTYPVLLRPGHLEIIEEQLTSFSYSVLSAFQSGNRVKNVLEDILDRFENVSDEEEGKIENVVIEQINHFIQTGILLENH